MTTLPDPAPSNTDNPWLQLILDSNQRDPDNPSAYWNAMQDGLIIHGFWKAVEGYTPNRASGVGQQSAQVFYDDLCEVEMGDGINFKNVEFDQVDFMGAVFLSSTYFDHARFINDVKFRDAKFYCFANFDYSSFRKLAYFELVHFYDVVSFEVTEFNGGVWFNKAKFGPPPEAPSAENQCSVSINANSRKLPHLSVVVFVEEQNLVQKKQQFQTRMCHFVLKMQSFLNLLLSI